MKKSIIFSIISLFAIHTSAQFVPADPLYGHKWEYDRAGGVLGWYQPEIPGAVYHQVVKLSSGFLLQCPVEPKTGLPMYLVTCCFLGPHMTPDKTFVARDWMHDPACFFAGCVQSLAVRYRPYSGDHRFIALVQDMLDYQLAHGTTPENFAWPDVPYASSDPFETEYRGSVRWKERGDGLYGIEPDKVGELGYAYLLFYEITENEKYLQAALHCADALAKNVRNIREREPGEENDAIIVDRSPWPFRVNAQTGTALNQYCSNVLEPVNLLKEAVRIKDRIGLSDDRATLYQQAADLAWNWLYAKNGPLRTFIWNGYFEDVESDPTISNRVQITPVELAKYFAVHEPEKANIHVPALLEYARSAFKTPGLEAMNEQLWCYRPMGSHTARYGAACALWFERSGEQRFKEMAFRYLNVASYTTHDNGVVSTGLEYPGSWFSDGYSDYIRHFLDAMAAVPEWAPRDENHCLRSSSVIQTIDYQKKHITYSTFDPSSVETFKLTKKPSTVMAGTTIIKETSATTSEGWSWKKCGKGGVLTVRHLRDRSILIRW
jgi:hypothetical protein